VPSLCPSRLRGVTQSVIRSRNGFATPRLPRLADLWVHFSRSTPRASTGLIVETRCGCGPDGTRQSRTSCKLHPCSGHPARIAGVQGRHCFAEPAPWVAMGGGRGWRRLAWGRQQLGARWHSTSCWRQPACPWPSGVTRRPTAAPRCRLSRLRRSMQAVVLRRPPAARPCGTRSMVPNPTRGCTPTTRWRR
jgi:hypothetical protein